MLWAWAACSPDPGVAPEPEDPLPIPDDDGRLGPEPEVGWSSEPLYLVGYCPLPGVVLADHIPDFAPAAIRSTDGTTLPAPEAEAPYGFVTQVPGRRYGPAGSGCILGGTVFHPEPVDDPVRRYEPGDPGATWTRPGEYLVATSDEVVVTSSVDTLIGVDAAAGTELWRTVWPEPGGFIYTSDDEVHRASGCADLGVTFVNGDGFYSLGERVVGAIDLASGAVLWEQDGDNRGPTSWHCAAGRVVVSWEGEVVAYDAITGAVLWHQEWTRFGGGGSSFDGGRILSLDARYVLVLPDDEFLVSLVDVTDGALRWSFPGAGSGAGYARGLLTETSAVLHLHDRGIVSLDLADATVRWHRAWLGSSWGYENMALTYEGEILHTTEDAAGVHHTDLVYDRPAD